MGMSRRARRVLLTIGIVVGVVLLLLASLSVLVRIPPIQAQIRSRIESELQSQLNREVRIGGVALGFLLWSLDFRDVRIASQERLEDGVLAEVEGVHIYPNLADLFRFRLSLGRIVVRRPIVNIPPPEAKPAVPTPAQTPPPESTLGTGPVDPRYAPTRHRARGNPRWIGHMARVRRAPCRGRSGRRRSSARRCPFSDPADRTEQD